MPTASSQSPPKRMTRSRAKAVEEKQQTQVITTAGAKAAASKSTKRKPGNEDLAADGNNEGGEVSAPQAKQPSYSQPTRSTRGRAKANETSVETSDTKAIAPKTRGRGRATAVKKDEENDPRAAAKPVATRTTRGKAAAEKQASATTTKRAGKKVVFEDEQETNKENIVEIRPTSKDGKNIIVEEKASAMNKAPRKGKLGVTRPGKAESTNRSQGDEKSGTVPLSPKKLTQVAKGNINSEPPIIPNAPSQSPSRLLDQSPQKAMWPSSNSPLKKAPAPTTMDVSSVDEPQSSCETSPVKQAGPTIGGSPPKRPPPSPSKASMRDSPKKLNLDMPTSRTATSPTKEGPTGSSFAQTPARKPPSPIKLFQSNSTQKAVQTLGAASKSSLLQSPAKRPPSTIKPSKFTSRTPQRNSSTAKMDPTRSVLRQSPQKFNMPQKLSPGKKVDREACETPKPISQTQQAEQGDSMLIDELASGPLPFTPMPKPERAAKASIGEFLTRDVLGSTTSPSKPDSRPNFFSNSDLAEPTSTLTQSNGVDIARADTYDADIFEESPILHDNEDTLVANPSAAFQPNSPPVHLAMADDSEDELMTDDPKYDVSPIRRPTKVKVAPSIMEVDVFQSTPQPKANPLEALSMTGLAERFGGWAGATPDAKVLEQRKADGFIFSPTKMQPEKPNTSSVDVQSPSDLTNTFEEAIQIHEDDTDELSLDHGNDTDLFRQSKVSEASQNYGDENDIPIDPALTDSTHAEPATCTPQRLERHEPRVPYTASKVPLKPAAHDHDLSLDAKANIKKRRSFASALTPRADVELQALRQIYPRSTQGGGLLQTQEDSQVAFGDAESGPLTPHQGPPCWSLAATPVHTPRSNVDSKLLNGAVVFVDVHTSEGADASGVFVDLLQQMGATVRSSWSWNPSFEDEHDVLGKIGITHVVFKDGGKRTMEKVRLAKGIVTCVGVGWVLDCERENKWLNEADYAIDSTFVPRGGHRRRKSMEPKLLSNMNGTLSATNKSRKPSPPSLSKRRVTIAVPATAEDDRQEQVTLLARSEKNEKNVSMDEDSEDELAIPSSPAPFKLPETPARPYMITGGPNSPTTPYFLHPTQIVQQTCPPKQSQQAMFPLSGRIQDQPDESMRQRLMTARRKSLQFAPKVKSPLSKDFF